MAQAADYRSNKPVIFLAFAQDREEGGRYLRNLPNELDAIRNALQKAKQAGLCELVERSNTTVENILDVFQEYQDRIAIFHYGGHAGSYELLLESLTGKHAVAHSEGLVSFLAKQKGLQLVFLNGCSSQQQAVDLIEAGLPAVIGTSKSIDDGIATNLSERFYKGLAAGLSIDRAWTDAVRQVEIEKGKSNTRAMHWEGEVEDSKRFPWDISYRKGAEMVKEWNLPAAANQPLFGLPLPETYYRKLPPKPFVWLQDFKQDDAAIFFGRGAEIRRLYTQITTSVQPIILFYGKVGVGKSSLLQAGLMPRIESSHVVSYARHDPTKGLTDTFIQTLQALGEQLGLAPVEGVENAEQRKKIEQLRESLTGNTGFAREVLESELQRLTRFGNQTLSLSEYWHRIEEKAGRPLVIILDQIEAKPLGHLVGNGQSTTLQNFIDSVRSIFGSAGILPKGKLILSYREEFHHTFRDAFQKFSVPYTESFLSSLRWDGIVEAIEGVTIHPATRDQYHLDIERGSGNNFPELIADDLLEGNESPLAPMLQVVLTVLWKEAYHDNPRAPRFTVELYHEMKHNGTLMRGFFKLQMERLHAWRKEAVGSGLILDVLYRHTTTLGTAAIVSREQLHDIYAGREATVNELIAACQDCYLLVDDLRRGTSLAHNFLAAVVIGEFGASVKPGQQAARILNSKIEEFRADTKGIWLNDADLDLVETGKEAMRKLDADEERLLQISREHNAQREKDRRRNRVIRNVLVAVIFFFAVLAGWKWWESQRNFKQSKANQLAFVARDVFKTDNTVALRVAGEAYSILESNPPPTVTQTLSDVFHSQDITPFYAAMFGHTNYVNSAVFSPYGQYVLTASDDGFAKLWDLRGTLFHSFNHDGISVSEADFSPNGKQVLTLANDIVRLWETNGKLVDSRKLVDSTKGTNLASFSTDGMRIIPRPAFAGGEDEHYRMLIDSLKTKNHDAKLGPNKNRILIISPDEIVRLFDGEGKSRKDSVASNAVWADFSSDGKQFLTVSRFGDSLSIIGFWDEQGNSLGDFKYKDWVTRAVFSPDGKQILTAAKNYSAKLWDFSRKFVHRLLHRGPVNTAVFSPDGKGFVTASRDKLARLWDEQGNLLDSLKHERSVTSAVFSPDGKRILTASEDGTARLWIHEERRSVPLVHRGNVNAAIFYHDGSRILTASSDSTARLWTANGDPVDTLRHHGKVISAMFSSDGRQILTVSSDSAATLWGANGDSLRTFKHRGDIKSAIFSSDGRYILTGSTDSTAILWKIDGTPVAHPFNHGDEVNVVAISPDGSRILTANKIVKVWDVKGNLLDSLTHVKAVKTAVFSYDGEQVLTASVDATAKLWNLKGEVLANYGKHTDQVKSAGFSPDGKKILTASTDGYAIIWWTPRAIHEWLKTAPVYKLTPVEEELYGIVH